MAFPHDEPEPFLIGDGSTHASGVQAMINALVHVRLAYEEGEHLCAGEMYLQNSEYCTTIQKKFRAAIPYGRAGYQGPTKSFEELCAQLHRECDRVIERARMRLT